MQLHIMGRNIELTPALRDFTTEKFKRLLHRDPTISNVNVTFTVEKVDHLAEATLHVNGCELHATAKGKDMYSAVDKLIDKFSTQITKNKEKHSGHH